MVATWKLDPSLRGRIAADDAGPFDIIVQPHARLSEADRRLSESTGLTPAAGGDLCGTVDRPTLLKLLEAGWVGYVHDASVSAASGATSGTPAPHVPAKPAKRGHTMLPPRRD